MEGNKDEANRCIELAEKYIKEKNRDKAEKFLHKAEKLFPTHKAKELLLKINLMAPSSSEATQTRKRRAAQNVEETEKRAPEYSIEQEEAVKRIKKCKDYYEILCVSKDSTDSEIKKAYKKLALQMHPDKNKCPGASEAFKAIGNAVAVLTDAEKRKQYDLYGSDEERMATRSSNHHHTYSRGFESDATAEELFNMFFGTGFNGSNVYVRRGGRWQRQTSGSQQEHHPHHRENPEEPVCQNAHHVSSETGNGNCEYRDKDENQQGIENQREWPYWNWGEYQCRGGYGDYQGTSREYINNYNYAHSVHYAAFPVPTMVPSPMWFPSHFATSPKWVNMNGTWQQSGFTAFIQILPILLAILLSMASSFFISDPAYSLQVNSKYPIARKTQNLNVPYYVKENFHTEYQGSVRRLELSVEEEYISNLRHACYREKNYRDSMIWKARNFGDGELFQTAQNIKMPSCEQLQNLRNHG